MSAGVGPIFISLLRVWIALALVSTTTAIGATLAAIAPTLPLWIPLSAATLLPTELCRIGGALLLLGLGSRYTVTAMLIALFSGAMMDGRMLDSAYLFSVLGILLIEGAGCFYFGNERWASAAPGLKRMEDALEIRRRVLTAFELAESASSRTDQEALLTFLIVGGGPTGVELAGAIAELAKYGMSREFRTFDPATARVILVQSAPGLLPAFPDSLASVALRCLQSLGVEVMLGCRVEEINTAGARVNGVEIPARTVLWAAGVTASPAADWLNAPKDNAGRIKVGSDLAVPGLFQTFAIGDTAFSMAWKGKPVPGLAPAAKHGGIYVADVIKATIESRGARAPFRYRHLGSLATIGRKAAVADFGIIRIWGAPAWWLWGLIHVGFLVGARNRAATLLNWFWAYLTFGGGARLTAVSDISQAPVEPPPHGRG